MNRKTQVIKYLSADLISAIFSWSLFFIYRKLSDFPALFDHKELIYDDPKFYIGTIAITVFWLLLYTTNGTYRRIYRKSRLKEFGQTLLHSLIGITIIFFVIILDDFVTSYISYYKFFIVLFSLHFSSTFLLRFTITSVTAKKIHTKKIGFPTIIVGGKENAVSIYQDIENQTKSSGNIFKGFVHMEETGKYPISEYLPHLGNINELKRIINEQKIEEVIIAIEKSEHKTIESIIAEIAETNVIIKIIPDLNDFITSTVKMGSMFDIPLIQIHPDLMPAWQQTLKRFFDIFFSLFCLIFLSPVYILLTICVKSSSKGSVFYSHERIGRYGKPFIMHKFRSMYEDAEKNGPQLSCKDDKRITPFGKFLRKVRLDEIPQFYNVLKGDMSLVGPRPERQFYIDQIVKKAPHYKLLCKVKPGITSWGQVKYGYAENVSQMIERLKYEILYIENMSLAMDFKILVYTVLIVLQGRGK